MKKLFFLHITGNVQGVSFRAATKEKAESLGVKGIVRNEPDGSVYIEAEAEEATAREFIDWCHKGPSNAKVTKIDVQGGNLKGHADFHIQWSPLEKAH
jgi:acylphosphatase